jgi:hypothetical protein
VEQYLTSPEGVDRMQIWEFLHRTADERLAELQSLADSFGPFVLADFDQHAGQLR